MAMCRHRGERVIRTTIPGKARKRTSLHLGRAQPVLKVGLKDGPWPDLEEDAMPQTDQLGNGVGEAHWVADVAPPVFGIELFGFDCIAGNRRYEQRFGRA